MYPEFQPEEGYRLLPRAVEDGLRQFLGRGTGFALLGFLVVAWLSLVTWSVNDPSLTHVTREPASNLFGYFGAVISDLMLQTLGLASAALLFAPMFWALELAHVGQVKGARWKILAQAACVLLLAGAFAAVPKIVDWPLNHGYGGIAGDGLLSLALWGTNQFAAPYAVLLSGFVMGLAGAYFGFTASGIELASMKRFGQSALEAGQDRLRQRYGLAPKPRRPSGPREPGREKRTYAYRASHAVDRHRHEDVGEPDEPRRMRGWEAADDDDRDRYRYSEDDYQSRRYGIRLPTGKPQNAVEREEPREPTRPELKRPAPAQKPAVEKVAAKPPEQDPDIDEFDPFTKHDPDFEEATEEGSRRIAAKFAPAGAPAAHATTHGDGGKPRFGIGLSERRHAQEPLEKKPDQVARPKLPPEKPRRPKEERVEAADRAERKETNGKAPLPKAAAAPEAISADGTQPELPGLFEAPQSSDAKQPPKRVRKTVKAKRGGLFGARPMRVAKERSADSARSIAEEAPEIPVSEPDSDQVRQVGQNRGESRDTSSPAVEPVAPAEPEEYVVHLDEFEPLPEPDLGAAAGPRPKLKMAGGYHRPSLNLLGRTPAARPGPEMTQAVLRGTSRLLEDVLERFGVNGEMSEIRPGPVVTVYQFAPEKGTNTSRVIGLADDIARAMSVGSARVVAFDGGNEIGIELPNVHRAQVGLREVLCTESYRSSGGELPIALGVSMGGSPVVANLADFSNTLIVGAPGSGKSTCLKSMILSLVYRNSPSECRFLMIDSGYLDFAAFNDVSHLLAPVISETGPACAALDWLVAEIDERAKRMAKLSARTLDVFNNRVRHARKRGEMIARTVHTGFCDKTGQPIYEHVEMEFEPMPHIAVFIDDLCDLMGMHGPRVEDALVQIGARGKSVGIHLIAGTRTTAELCVTRALQDSFQSRLVFKLGSKACSRKMLGDQGAEQLLEFGDMILQTEPSYNLRVHTAHVTQDEFEAVAQSMRDACRPKYWPSLMAALKDNS